MFALSETQHYYLYRKPADMRKGFDGLSGIVRSQMSRDPQDGSVYLFINRRRDLYYKRLEMGTYELPTGIASSEVLHLNWETLVLMIRGIRLAKISRKKRYVRA